MKSFSLFGSSTAPPLKAMNFLTVLLVLMTCMLGACAPKQAIDASAIDQPLRAVCVRHDAYVNKDATLSDVEKRTALRSTQLLLDILTTAEVAGATPAPTPAPAPAPVSAVHFDTGGMSPTQVRKEPNPPRSGGV